MLKEFQIDLKDGYSIDLTTVILYSVGILIFLTGSILTLVNVCKFNKHRSFPLGVFYTLMLIDFLIRLTYFALNFFYRTEFTDLFLLCLAPSISCSIGVCQIMNYVVLYNRLKTYETLRTKRDQEFEPDSELKHLGWEYWIYGVSMFTIMLIPGSVMVRLFLMMNTYQPTSAVFIDSFEQF